jgi:hypothetical protein
MVAPPGVGMAAFNNSCTPEIVFDVLLPGWKPPGKEGFGWRLFSRAKLTITCLRTSVRDSRLLLCCGSVMLTNVKSCSCWAASPTPGRDPCKRCGARLASVLVVQLACEMTTRYKGSEAGTLRLTAEWAFGCQWLVSRLALGCAGGR